MTLPDCIEWLRSRGLYYADQPLTVERAVYDAREARMAGMLRAIEAHATSVARVPPEGVQWEVDDGRG